MTLSEVETHIKTFEKRINDPSLTEQQRAVFVTALEGAQKRRDEILAMEEDVKQTAAKSGRGQGNTPPPNTTNTLEWEQATGNPAISVQDNGQQKKTLVQSFARIVDTISTPGNETEIVVDCDLESLSKTVMIFRWGKSEERLTPGLTMCRFKARVDDVANLDKKKPEESRCFHRAVAYYAGLSQFCGRELTQTDFGFRGRKANVLETIQEAYRNQKQQANA